MKKLSDKLVDFAPPYLVNDIKQLEAELAEARADVEFWKRKTTDWERKYYADSGVGAWK